MKNPTKHKTCFYKSISLIVVTLMALLSVSCIEDGFTLSPSDRPEFSVDTLKMGTIFTGETSATHRLTVYNRHSKGLNLQSVAVSGENAGLFRINVDGMSGTSFADIEIRANDSIYVFVCADLPANGENTPQTITAKLDFMVNGQLSSIVVSADGQDITRKRGCIITKDTHFDARCPYQIIDSLVVTEGATLTLEPGARLLFHDNSSLIVRGTLQSLGTAEQPVRLSGDRMGNVITDVSFDLMSRQWLGIMIAETARDCRMEYTDVSNTCDGVIVCGDGMQVDEPRLTLVNSRLRNSGGDGLTAYGASVAAYGCEFAEAAGSLVVLYGGSHRFDRCTAANNYLFAAVSGAAWMILDPSAESETYDWQPTRALITNTITYGLGGDVMPGDLTGMEVYFKRCLFKSAGTDDDNFVDSLWDTDPLFYTVRADYLFDYRVKPESPAIGAAHAELSEWLPATDYYGVPLKGDLGAYVYVEPEP